MSKGMHLTRVATQLSINQDTDKETMPTCVASACRRHARLPLYSYGLRQEKVLRRFLKRPRLQPGDQVVPSNSPTSSRTSSDDDIQDRSLLDTVILAQWEDRFEKGLFRYDVTACPTMVLDGVYGFVAQLNEGRATKKRPTEFSIDQVLQDFDPNKFNFTKADEKEMLLQFQPWETHPLHSRSDSARQATYCEKTTIQGSPNVVVINVSPIEYGHVLLVPRLMDCLPQMLTPDLVLTALHFTAEAGNPYFRVGYNSLGAYATINHCHFQAYFLTAHFPIERAPSAPLNSANGRRHHASTGDVSVQRLAGFPVRTLVFELGSSLEELADAVGAACVAMQDADMAFNLIVVDKGARVFLIPNKFATRVVNGEIPEDVIETGINPAAFEIAGHLLYKKASDYESATQESAWKLLEQASLTEAEFEDLVEKLLPRKGFRTSEWTES